MGTILGDKPTDSFDRTAVLDAARPVRRTGRLRYVAGGVVVAVAAATILVTAVLPARAPAPAHPSTLPPMSSSMGFWDFVSYPQQPVGRPNHLERPDVSAAAQQPALPATSDSSVYEDRTSASTSTLPPMSNDMGFWDRLPSSAPARPTSLERAGHERPQPAAPAYVSWPETRTDLAVDSRAPDAAALRPARPAISDSAGPPRSITGYWDYAPAPIASAPATSNSSYPELAGLPSMPAGMGYWDAASPNTAWDSTPYTAAAPRPAIGATTDRTAEDGVGRFELGGGRPAGLETFRYTGQPSTVQPSTSSYGPTGGITGY